ncbi:SAM-dependent methyltransferase [Chitinophagaceae bacterium MMS25-I14]
MTHITVRPVAIVRNSRKSISDDFWGDVITEIELADDIPTDAFDGIEMFSHLEVIFYFDKTDPARQIFSGHPRENKEWPSVGIFAQRKKDRINSLGLTTVTLLERKGRSIFVRNFDALDGTPVIDIKPVMKEFAVDRSAIKQPDWATALMKDYWSVR